MNRHHLHVVRGGAEPSALASVYRRYATYVAGVAFRLLGRDSEVDDVVQDVFVAAAEGLDTVRDAEAVKGWLATIAVRMAMRKLRRRKLRSFFGLEVVTENDIARRGVDPADRVMAARVYAVLDELPTRSRVAWVLHRVEGETLPEVAARCGCSLATVKRVIASAQQAIEERLS